MKLYFSFLICLVFIHKPIIMANTEIQALELLNTCNDSSLPQKLSLERFATLNGHGYIFWITNPIAQAFIDHAGPQKRFLEIGAGFSQTTQQCLARKVSEYTVNDLSLEHLKILCLHLQKTFGDKTADYLRHLSILPGRVPDVLTVKKDHYDAILLDKVFHFFAPTDAETFLAWAHEALKADGKLYIFTISPYCSGFNVGAVYQEQKEKNDLYPGYIKNVHNYLQASTSTNPNYVIPETTTFFKLEDLIKVLENKGFIVEKTMAARLPRNETPAWIESEEKRCDLIGVIAKKRDGILTTV